MNPDGKLAISSSYFEQKLKSPINKTSSILSSIGFANSFNYFCLINIEWSIDSKWDVHTVNILEFIIAWPKSRDLPCIEGNLISKYSIANLDKIRTPYPLIELPEMQYFYLTILESRTSFKKDGMTSCKQMMSGSILSIMSMSRWYLSYW